MVIFQPWKGTSPDLVSFAIVDLFSVLSAPPVTTVLWIFFFPPRTYILPPPHISPLDASSLSLLYPLLSPISPGIIVTVHMNCAPTRRLPSLVSVISSLFGRTLEFRAALKCPSSVIPPFVALDHHPCPCHLLGVVLYEGPFLSLPSFVALTSASPPCWTRPSAQSLPVPRGLRHVLIVPLSLVYPNLPPCVLLRFLVSSGY